MASNSFKNPPSFDPKLMTYETWKNEIEVWKLVTDLDANKHALAVSLSLKGNARDVAMEITAADLAKETGMETLIASLDKVFKRDDKDKAYEAYKNFDSYHKPDEMSMSDYIMEFDKRYNKAKKYEMTLPDAVLAFKLLDNAGLSTKDKQLALTASSDLKYAAMKSALQRIFGESPSACATDTPSITIKQEPVFYTQQRRFNRKPDTKLTGTNPINKFGKRTKCAVCQSVFHWAKDCPDKTSSAKITESESDIIENCNVTLFTKEQPSANEIFVLESAGSAIIDTACTRTVCGEKWFEHFVKVANDNDIQTFPSNRAFKFGDGKVVNSFCRAIIPAEFGKTLCKIEIEVVKADIPLLLSKSSLKKAGTVLDLKNDKVTMFGSPVCLECTSSGHYCVNILKANDKTCENELEEVLEFTEMTQKEKMKALDKLHKQFGHASVDRLSKLLINAGTSDQETIELLRSVCEKCEICIVNKKPVPRPAVGLPLATQFNETVAVDLHELEHGIYYLHIIDEFTRFSAGSIMRSKRSSEFVKKFLESWIAVHGAPKRLYSDNGGEFNNDEVRDMAENFDIEVKTTAGYSPWSNGLLERHNQTLTEILMKIKADNRCDWETALNWALMAKNALDNVHGYSSYQLVYGRNPNLPSVLTSKPPALEGTTMSAVVGRHIEALHSARSAFTKSECSERIKRALRKQTRPSGIRYHTGDKVYYKRNESNEWKGPGVVIGQDGAVIFIRHGGILVRVHQCRLKKTSQMEDKIVKVTNNNKLAANTNTSTCSEKDPTYIYDSDSETEPIDNRDNDNENINEEATGNDEPERFKLKDVKVGQTLGYHNVENGEHCVAKVTGRAGKLTGNNKHWFNLEYMEPESLKGAEISVDLSKVEPLENINDNSKSDHDNDTALVLENISFKDAKMKELESWKRNGVYVEHKNIGQKCISTRWICNLKDTPDGTIHKARLVARGFEEIDKENLPKDSPTCGSDSLRLVLAVLAQRQWQTHTMDIKTAFLQGAEIEREIFVKPPPEANCKDVVWKLRKCVYGLSDASLSWYNRVKEVLEQCNVHVSKVDPAVFFWRNKTGLVDGVLACHVDDFLWGGTLEFEREVINKIRSTFYVGREDQEENGSFPFVGIEISKCGKNIILQQKSYQNNMQSIPIEKCRQADKSAPINTIEKEQLQSKIGQILWMARQSRPDVIFEASYLASSLKTATVQTLIDANKVIKNLKSENVSLKFQYLGPNDNVKLLMFSDSSLGNLPDGGTQGGHFIALVGENGIISPLTWTSKRTRRIVRSTLAAETLAMVDGIDNAIYLASLYTELMTEKANPISLQIICITDCHSLLDAIMSTKQTNEKRLRLEISGIKELINNCQIVAVKWIETKSQLADCLTKKGASPLNLLRALETGAWRDQCLKM